MITDLEVASQDVATVLFVDDEPNILSALRRVFQWQGYRLHTAQSASEGLKLLEREVVDVVVSDMRMPEISGAQFLGEVRSRWPETVRILLTGHSDVDSTVAAINDGGICRYIAKPWDEREIQLVVRQALERKALEREKARLEKLVRRQNEELRDLNSTLEAKVLARTQDLQAALGSLSEANGKLRKNFITSIKVFTNLIELRSTGVAGHSQRVADLAWKIAKKLDMPPAEAQDVMLAAMLHDIGKVGLPDALQARPFSDLTKEERALVMRHPVTGAAALMALEQLAGAASLIRCHHELFDGSGYPDGSSALDIPLGARVLTVANEYHELRAGSPRSRRLGAGETIDYMRERRGKRYDPAIVDVLVELLGGESRDVNDVVEVACRCRQLEPGMIVTQDLMTRDGIMLLAKDHVLDVALITKLGRFEQSDGHPLTVYVQLTRRITPEELRHLQTVATVP